MTLRRNDATEAQVRAANPSGSAWLAANAGSGKTRVLTDRVARLLLKGVDPQQILCLTYTKAAATEMQNRLFKRLGAWSMQDSDTLLQELQELGEDKPFGRDDLRHARTLFARAIEVPGGLKIQTIHSFCASLLRRFPLEAGVNPLFEEMEQRSAQLLQAEIVDQMIDGDDRPAVDGFMLHFTGAEFGRFLEEIVSHQDDLSIAKSWSDIARSYELDRDFGNSDIEGIAFNGDEHDLITSLLPALEQSGVTDQRLAQRLRAVSAFDYAVIPTLQSILLTQKGQPLKKFPAKKVQAAHPESCEALVEFMERLVQAREAQFALNAARKTHALHQFAEPFLRRYARAKAIRGWLDFDDLIFRTRALLRDEKVAAWVLYRLDGGISHLLVDEAQDTSPAQWDVVRLLTQEFTSGLGSRDDDPRTLFVVGDKKQSIYSFQGADPDEFDRMEQEFGNKLRAVEQPFSSQSLEYSFRSSDAILRLVDQTFVGQDSAGFVPDQKHRAFHSDKPGRVDLWPIVEKGESKDDRSWTDPVDFVPDTHHTVILARQVADQIHNLLDPASPEFIPEKGEDGYKLRPVRAEDILILVQRRSLLFHEIIRACKQRDLPIAGADRLRVGAELAVRDLLALLSFLATPEDSLSLATVLRSPLFGWSEADLFSLANVRVETHLWETLRKQKDVHSETFEKLQDLRGQIDFLRPFDLLERVLTRHSGRENLLARLGVEAEDGINAILSQALAYERTSIPSLTGFLIWAQADDLEIKRQVDSAGNLIRVMTVHGAKGLEAPIVILPDCGSRRLDVRDNVLTGDSSAHWKTASDAQPEAVRDLVDNKKDAEARERQRLLYVAMTRAETWLIVAAAGDLSKDGSDWYQTIEAGMTSVGAAPFSFSFGIGLRYEFENWSLPTKSATPEMHEETSELEPFFRTPLDHVPARDVTLSPSDLGGAKALPSELGLDEDVALARGTYVHHLLEILAAHPPTEWATLLTAIEKPRVLTAPLIEAAQQEAIQVLQNTSLDWIFDPDAMAEVSVHGKLGDHAIMGTIDRLILNEDAVIIIDFKTNLAVPKSAEHCPEGLLRQMGAYASILQQIYPDYEINTGILWTATGQYMSLTQNMVSDACTRIPYLDGTPVAT